MCATLHVIDILLGVVTLWRSFLPLICYDPLSIHRRSYSEGGYDASRPPFRLICYPDLICGLRRSTPYAVALIPTSYLLHLFLLHFPFAGVLVLKEGMTPKAQAVHPSV